MKPAQKNQKKLPVIAVTLGDPQGIGPEIVELALQDPKIKKLAQWKIFGFTSVKKLLPWQAGELSLLALEEALAAIDRGDCQALVTAPISKDHIHQTGFAFPGHTEFLAHHFKANQHVMMFVSPKLKVSLVTIHEPISNLSKLITKKRVADTIALTHQALKNDFGIENPTLAVCGLNPHAGENGLFGQEDAKHILPAVRDCCKKGMKVVGPLPADTLFYQATQGKYDAVVAMYHDQGLIPVKTLDFHHGVNMTLGLPIVRTSPDQGCAFDIAGKGLANPQSMKEAMKLAATLCGQRDKAKR